MGNYLLKISSAGNRFLIADNRWFNNTLPSGWKNATFKTQWDFSDFLKLAKQPLKTRKIFINCFIIHKKLSLTDGLIVLKKSKKFLFECDFYNKDGSKAEMCGNAACCLSFYANDLALPIKPFLLGKQTLSYRKGKEALLNKKPVSFGNYDFTFGEQKGSFTLIDSGVPHAVLKCPIKGMAGFKNKAFLKKLAQHLRFKNPKDKKGMNISFFKVETANHLKAVTYERGVEGWTLACGTGALAVAFAHLNKQKNLKSKFIYIHMPGGQLKVQLQPKTILFSPVKKGY